MNLVRFASVTIDSVLIDVAPMTVKFPELQSSDAAIEFVSHFEIMEFVDEFRVEAGMNEDDEIPECRVGAKYELIVGIGSSREVRLRSDSAL